MRLPASLRPDRPARISLLRSLGNILIQMLREIAFGAQRIHHYLVYTDFGEVLGADPGAEVNRFTDLADYIQEIGKMAGDVSSDSSSRRTWYAG